MNPDNRALTGIQSNIGAIGMDASALGGTTMPMHGFLDITRVGRNEMSQNTQRFNPQEVIARFGDAGAVGFNPFFKAPETATKVFTA